MAFSNRTTLSKSILEMKFMKKTRDKVEKETSQREGEEYFGNVFSLPKKCGNYITEGSYAFCEGLIEGRLSFQGENPELERLLELEEVEKTGKKEERMTADVSDEQMAAVWKSTTKINVKNILKNERDPADPNEEPKRKKLKFLKPAD
ncbi:hypothetical protein QAD02_016717 [Eretmocerus hayati]|uniref:Uncharacterized protein n=1 Tax=Eretmocerus hayati TaxID=131215 RepID=A0ACC2PBZ0_9HYME|nr:hypothetical protein QAD02_016717 [Eretmocerus hayati]